MVNYKKLTLLSPGRRGGECLKTNALLAFAMIHTVDFFLTSQVQSVQVIRKSTIVDNISLQTSR